METGNKNSQENLDSLADHNLFIHLRQDGVSALATEDLNSGFLAIKSRSWLATDNYDALTDHLESFLTDNGISVEEAASVSFFISSPKFTLIPDILYQQDSGSTYLSNTCRLDSTDLIFSDFLTHRDAVLIYALDKSFYDKLNSYNSSTHVIHNAYALNALALKSKVAGSDLFLASISDSFAELLIVKDDKLMFYNQFPHDVPEDLLYYLLFVLEQNRILAPEVKLQILNLSKGDSSELKKLLSTYIGSVDDISYKPTARDSHRFAQTELRKVAHMHCAI